MEIDIYFDDAEKSTKFKLLRDIPAVFGNKLYFIPKGFISDGLSAPRFVWPWIQPLSGKYIKIACKHDFGYNRHIMTRAEIDKEMLDDLLAEGMCPIKSYIIYFCVRFFRWQSLG